MISIVTNPNTRSGHFGTLQLGVHFLLYPWSTLIRSMEGSQEVRETDGVYMCWCGGEICVSHQAGLIEATRPKTEVSVTAGLSNFIFPWLNT